MTKRIMIVDDEPHNLAILRIFLNSLGYEVFEAECGKDALVNVMDILPDLILLDVMMPDLSGFNVAEIWRDQPGFNIPIVFLSAKVQKDDILQGLQLGAVDYLTKPFDLDLIEKKISIVIANRTEILNLKSENAELSLKVNIDPVTSLYNRNYLQSVIEQVKEGGMQFAIAMMIDIDYFKEINDEHGHLMGDQVLKEVAKIILSSIRAGHDAAFRYGGDEFLVLLVEERNYLSIAESIRGQVDALNLITPFKRSIQVSVSLGLSKSYKYKTTERVIACADTALYDAKNRGRNRIYIS
ncbi:diguanylate cyclase [Paenibacillus psychroresistens]|uniref:Diguanylate cyclase n=1 Tax=Paenibacillus psychroresistens TaxID=1778678 RepID=A0A6B8RMA6_9BACL|nr:diguanylate cyclase [Paenibacillus psychroresistens]QGQ96536.1 diguanylate cyclase [Paenibacillus psychroresistens]